MKMEYRKLLHGSEQISVLGFGTSSIGMAGEKETEATMAMALEAGVNYFDMASADAVPFGAFGRAMAGQREKVYFQIHFGADYQSGTYGWTTDLDTIKRSVDWQLKELKTDYIDFYFMHWPDVSTPIAETMCALNFLKEQGKIRYIGLSNTELPLLKEALKYGQVDVIQPPFSMIDQRYKETMEWASEHGIDVMAYGSMGGGILTGKYRSIPNWPAHDVRYTFYKGFSEPAFSKVMELMKTLDDIAVAHQATVSQVAINWTCQKDYVSSALIGVTSMRHVQENMDAFKWQLTSDEMKRIDDHLHELGLDQI